MQTDDLEEILERAQISNAENGITGALVYVEGVFLQVLEGDRASLEDLMARISRDVRHDNVTVLREGEVPSAAFSGWDMAYVSATREQVAKWAGLSGTTKMPDVLADIGQDPNHAAKVVKSILAMLAPAK